MNSSIIRFILGNVLKIEGLLLFLPAIVSGIYFENEGIYYISVAAVCIILGFFMTKKPPASHNIINLSIDVTHLNHSA